MLFIHKPKSGTVKQSNLGTVSSPSPFIFPPWLQPAKHPHHHLPLSTISHPNPTTTSTTPLKYTHHCQAGNPSLNLGAKKKFKGCDHWNLNLMAGICLEETQLKISAHFSHRRSTQGFKWNPSCSSINRASCKPLEASHFFLYLSVFKLSLHL